jgi:hypothetical protein
MYLAMSLGYIDRYENIARTVAPFFDFHGPTGPVSEH